VTSWITEDPYNNDPQSLEHAFTIYLGGSRLLPEKASSSNLPSDVSSSLDIPREPTTRKDLVTNIASLPILVWETIRHLVKRCSGMGYDRKPNKADIEGVLIHVGLHVLEPMLDELLGDVEDRDKAYLNGNMSIMGRYAQRNYKMLYMVPSIGQTRGIFCLTDGDFARANELANRLGWPLSTAITMALIAAMTQGEEFIPNYAVQLAEKEIENLKEWIKRSY